MLSFGGNSRTHDLVSALAREPSRILGKCLSSLAKHSRAALCVAGGAEKLRSDYRPSPVLPMTAWVEEASGLVRVVVPLGEETALYKRRKEEKWFPAGCT